MKQVLAAVVAMAGAGCATFRGEAQLGREKGPDVEVVESKVCRGAIDEAHQYLEGYRMPWHEREAVIERARMSVSQDKEWIGKGCCAQDSCAEPKEEK